MAESTLKILLGEHPQLIFGGAKQRKDLNSGKNAR